MDMKEIDDKIKEIDEKVKNIKVKSFDHLMLKTQAMQQAQNEDQRVTSLVQEMQKLEVTKKELQEEKKAKEKEEK